MSLTQTLGRGEERIAANGREWVLSAPTLGALLAAERELRRHMPGPLRKAAEAARHVPPEHAQAFWKLAYEEEKDWHPDFESLQQAAPIELQLASAALMLLHQHHRTEVATIDQAANWLAEVDLKEFEGKMTALLPPTPAAKNRPPKPRTGAR